MDCHNISCYFPQLMKLTRRRFVACAAAAAAAGISQALADSRDPATAAAASQPVAVNSLHWLEGAPAVLPGTAFGVPWPRGTMKAVREFSLRGETGENVPVQSWPLAYWPDGSIKWSAH